MLDQSSRRLITSLADHLDGSNRLADRQLLIERNGPAPRMSRAEDVAIPRVFSEADGQARLLVPIPRPRGSIVYVPGLGPSWVTGGPREHDTICRKIAERSGCAVLVVDWKRPPKGTHQEAQANVADALAWMSAQMPTASSPNRGLIIMGDGLGAGVATAVASGAGPVHGTDVALQVLICPAVEAVVPTPDADADDPLLDASQLELILAAYRRGASADRPEVSPLRAKTLAGAPPAVVVTAGADPLRPQGEAYAARLAQAGALVSHRTYPGQLHGFFNMLELLLGERALQDALNAINLYIVRGTEGLRRQTARAETEVLAIQ
ncbi:alpha/beta hydrolase [Acidimicrobiia bacterium EGI L10123]|uniref:alpha/beta hydrolase fold domain-containing protein n=1 Tax=Salinilacustrithrix flava TaxID=2957203 RepID=UPI003D7C2A6D|nr:alpha/beta hydrolase [Acidimicrobiia bacterium EGI L10123]